MKKALFLACVFVCTAATSQAQVDSPSHFANDKNGKSVYAYSDGSIQMYHRKTYAGSNRLEPARVAAPPGYYSKGRSIPVYDSRGRSTTVTLLQDVTIEKHIVNPTPMPPTPIGHTEEGREVVIVDGHLGYLNSQGGMVYYAINRLKLAEDLKGQTVGVHDQNGVAYQVTFDRNVRAVNTEQGGFKLVVTD